MSVRALERGKKKETERNTHIYSITIRQCAMLLDPVLVKQFLERCCHSVKIPIWIGSWSIFTNKFIIKFQVLREHKKYLANILKKTSDSAVDKFMSACNALYHWQNEKDYNNLYELFSWHCVGLHQTIYQSIPMEIHINVVQAIVNYTEWIQ